MLVIDTAPATSAWAQIVQILTLPITSLLFAWWNKADSWLGSLDKNVKAIAYVIIGTACIYAETAIQSLVTSHSPDWMFTGILGIIGTVIMTIQARTVITGTKENEVAKGNLDPAVLRK